MNPVSHQTEPFSFYRVAFIFCKALALSLWIGALTGLISASVLFAFNLLGFAPLAFYPNFIWLVQGLIALILGATAPALSAAMVGQSTLEGEAIAARRALPAAQKSLVRAGAGLMLLIFGAAPIIAGVPSLLLSPARFGSGPLSYFWMFAVQLLPSAFQVVIGFGLAFWPSLRRSVQSG